MNQQRLPGMSATISDLKIAVSKRNELQRRVDELRKELKELRTALQVECGNVMEFEAELLESGDAE
jgi:ribosomal protein L29